MLHVAYIYTFEVDWQGRIVAAGCDFLNVCSIIVIYLVAVVSDGTHNII